MGTEQNLPKVLIVDDEERWHRLYADLLCGKAEVIPAFTLDHGWQKFEENRDSITLIVMDASVPGDWPNSQPLIRKMREAGFNGPMVAAAGLADHRQMLVEAGCDIDPRGKLGVYDVVAEFLATRSQLSATNAAGHGATFKYALAPQRAAELRRLSREAGLIP